MTAWKKRALNERVSRGVLFKSSYLFESFYVCVFFLRQLVDGHNWQWSILLVLLCISIHLDFWLFWVVPLHKGPQVFSIVSLNPTPFFNEIQNCGVLQNNNENNISKWLLEKIDNLVFIHNRLIESFSGYIVWFGLNSRLMSGNISSKFYWIDIH